MLLSDRIASLRVVLTGPSFSGWSMITHHALPWDDQEWAHFPRAVDHVQTVFEHGLKKDTGITSRNVHTLNWRHWVVAFSVRHAATFNEEPLTLVECGVGDGLTAFFAANEAEHLGRQYQLHCYDIWGEVDTDRAASEYGQLSLERTRRNLAGRDVTYHPGAIPSTLDESAPTEVAYLSIDLNTAKPTVDALEFFLPRLTDRAVVLFDDYGHRGYEDTLRAVDRFFVGRRGSLLKMPTGQAIWLS